MAIAASKPPPKVLAVASSGGHWVQLLRMRPAWDGCDVTYVTTNAGYHGAVMADAKSRGQPLPRFHTVVAANRWQKLRLVRQALQILWLLVKARPDVVISTGAAPGFLALAIGKLMGARTIWVDSIANADELSLSGKKAGRYADLWLTQWKHLEGSERPDAKAPGYHGAVV